ncbi:Mediator of RNA polymerase II transcription subunit 6 [Apophysomyces sp. BC1034]|nr:Mediator of RNA polymerase II transcription subunit 6 [Apophysomyces sp. BC1021]KAG0186739.1 Mediator of RNA polymerase II transcription subunit 6 [Apophysomyces sp. BC1034]
MSPFWDRQCNNQILSMQTQYNDLRQPYEATVEALRKMTGIEFAVVHDQPPVWVIQKRYRRGTALDDVNPIATYYIMGANVYQSPTIYSVIANRLLTSLFHINSAFKETQKMMDFHPSKGYSWKSKAADKKDMTPLGTLRAQENQAFRHWMDRAIETSAARIPQNRHLEYNEAQGKGKANGSTADTTGSVSLRRLSSCCAYLALSPY